MEQIELMVERPRRMGVDAANVRVLTNLYRRHKTIMHVADVRSRWTEIQRSVGQGCVLSLNLF